MRIGNQVSYVDAKECVLTTMYILEITQARNQIFLDEGSKSGIVTQMQWGTLNCEKHIQ